MATARRSRITSVHHGLSLTAALLGAALLDPPAVRRRRSPWVRAQRAEQAR